MAEQSDLSKRINDLKEQAKTKMESVDTADISKRINELASQAKSEVEKAVNEAADDTNTMAQDDIDSNRVMGILAYLSWLVLVPIFAAKDSAFARFHANQGLVLAIVGTVLMAILSVLGSIPLLGLIFRLISWVVSIGLLLMAVLGIVNAAKGRAKELPVIGGIRILK